MADKAPLKEWLTKLGKRIEAGFPMLKLPDETARLYREELVVLAEEIGRDRAEQAVNNALRFCKYFPTIAEIRNAVPAAPNRGREWVISSDEKRQAIADDATPEAWILEALWAVFCGRKQRSKHGFFNGGRLIPPMPKGSLAYLDEIIEANPTVSIYQRLKDTLKPQPETEKTMGRRMA